MRQPQGRSRATLIEYAGPSPVVRSLARELGIEPAVVRAQIVSAGERVAGLLSLAANPFRVSDNDVRAADVAGLMRVSPRMEVEVAPKFLGTEWKTWREDFFFISMLSHHGRLLANESLDSASSDREDLASLVARAMISMFWENHRRPLRTYHQEDVADFVIDGDVDPESVVLPPVEGYSQRLVTYDRRNVFNATILAATRELLPEVRNPQIRRQLVRVAAVLAPQSAVRGVLHRRVPSRSSRWQSLHDLAVDVLRGFGLTYGATTFRAPGFVMDTWRAWEDLLTVALRLSWGSRNVDAQRPAVLGVRRSVEASGKSVSRIVSVRPDLVIKQGSGLVIDAKYKGRVGEDRNRISEADLYEALAFASAMKARRVVLLYPLVARGRAPTATGTTTVFETVGVNDVSIIGMEVEVRGIYRTGGLRRFADGIGGTLRPLTVSPVAA